MKKIYIISITMFSSLVLNAQSFIRSELPTPLTVPWEIVYGPDNFLWLTDSGGRVSRINPNTGIQQVAYIAPDYFPGSPQEQLQLCFQPDIGSGTLGLTLHPDFLNSSTAYIYFVYSYNNGTAAVPETKFKIRRLFWDANTQSVLSSNDIVTNISTGYDHLGGRLLAVKRNGIPYLFLSVGDHGISETNSPTCYNPQSTNPNNFAQDPLTDNGKIHRFNMDGTIPFDNPIQGNSFYTRGHRNPQGLMYNDGLDILYDIEHGDRTDDEINTLYAGMNYGWKYVRGYHDGLFPGEIDFINNYVPYVGITNDSLVEAFYSWCATVPDTSSNNLDWCTVAPSDGIYYGSNGIPQWTNSLLVVTLKDGISTDQQLYQFKLQANGDLLPPLPNDPNPKKYFANDQAINGRLRDIAVSPDGLKLFLINNSGAPTDKITVYTYDPTATAIGSVSEETGLTILPNPASEFFTITSYDPVKLVTIFDISGKEVMRYDGADINRVDIKGLSNGVYSCRIYSASGKETIKRLVKQQMN